MVLFYLPGGEAMYNGNTTRTAMMSRRERSINHPRLVAERSEDTTRVTDTYWREKESSASRFVRLDFHSTVRS